MDCAMLLIREVLLTKVDIVISTQESLPLQLSADRIMAEE
jgi:hypothetical protein